MLQLNPTIDVLTPKGKAEAIMIIDYGVNVNSVWLCRMGGGKVLHFYSDDIRVYDNPMNGNGWDVVPDFEKTQEDQDPPSGKDDIVMDFSKEEQPKTTIGAIDAKDLANTYAKKVIVSEPNFIKEDGSTPNKNKWWENFPFNLPLIGE